MSLKFCTKYLIYLNSYAFSMKVRSGTLGAGGGGLETHNPTFLQVYYSIQ